MKRFLTKIGWGMVKLVVTFVLLAAVARFVPAVNWFFFQRNTHTSVYYTTMALEEALATGRNYDILVLGSSTCEYSIDPVALADSTGLSVIKYVTGGQTTELSMRFATYLAPRLHCKYVLLDAFPRFGPVYTEEGVQRIILNTPDATSAFAVQTVSASPWALNTDILWAARAIGTSLKAYGEEDQDTDPDFVSLAPGYAKPRQDRIAPPASFTSWELYAEAVEVINQAHATLKASNQHLIALVPPVQYGWIKVNGEPEFEMMRPAFQPDTCFWDAVHLRQACVPAYTAEVARLFNAYRARVEANAVGK